MSTLPPPVVLAHQSGVGKSAYKRDSKVRSPSSNPKAYAYAPDDRYTIVPVRSFARDPRTHMQTPSVAWCAYYHGCRVGEVQQRRNPLDTERDLAAYLVERDKPLPIERGGSDFVRTD